MALVQAPTQNARLLAWVDEMVELCQPDDVHWFDGSDAEHELLCKQLVDAGHVHRARPGEARPARTGRTPTRATSPGSRTAPSSARRTRSTPARPTTGRTPPRCGPSSTSCSAAAMRGRTMYVVPFSMGPLGSPLSYIGVEITDSPYVAVSMRTMTRAGQAALDVLGADGEFVPCVHSVGAPLAAGRGRRAVAVQPRREVDRALPRDPRDLVVRLGLRRQRAARQEVLRAAHRVGDRARRGLARRAHAHPEDHEPRGARASTSPPRSRRRAARPTSRCSSRPSPAGRSRRSATTSRG